MGLAVGAHSVIWQWSWQRAVHPNETKLPTWGGETTDLQGTDLARRGRIFCLTVLASQLGSFGKHGQYHISG